MKQTFFSSAAVKLNTLVFSLVCSLLVAFGAGSYYRSKVDREASLHQQVDAALGRLASTLPSAVWNLDKKAMEEQLRADMASVYLQKAPENKAALRVSDRQDQPYNHTILVKKGTKPTVQDINKMLAGMEKAGLLKKVWAKNGVTN